jgi:hypothetical protein
MHHARVAEMLRGPLLLLTGNRLGYASCHRFSVGDTQEQRLALAAAQAGRAKAAATAA